MPRRVQIVVLALAALLCAAAPAPASIPVHGDDFGAGPRAVAARAPEAPRATMARTVASGPRSLAVILVNFADDRSQPWTPASVEQRVFGATDSVAAFFDEDSHGGVTFGGDVLGWYELSASGSGCDLGPLTTQARQAATADGADLAAYDHLMFVFPRVSDCRWSGMAHVDGPWSWINGTLDLSVLSHELGHNLGVDHAAAYACNAAGRPVTLSAECQLWEYGDPHSVMGAYGLRHNHAWHLEQLGFVPASKVQTVTASGTYTMRAAADPDASPVALRIPRTVGADGTPSDYYHLDVRDAWGAVDDWSPTAPVRNGVSIRLVPDTSVIRQSYLLDTTPGSRASPNSFADGALGVGHTFTEGDVSITTVSVADGEATVAVLFGPPPSLEQEEEEPPPAASGEPVVDEPAPDPVAAPEPASPAPAPPPGPPPAAPVLPAGTAAPAARDDARPHVRLRARRVRRRVRVLALATDDRRVVRLELWVDGRRRRTVRSPRLAWSGRLRRRRARRHVVVVRAFDAAGQRVRARVRVR